MTETATTQQPASCHVMAKPSGSVCNIDCKYCFYLEKEKLYPDARKSWRMSDETLEQYVKQYIEAQDVPVVNFAWQGGEPTLMGLDFFRRAVELQQHYANGKAITNAFQTNGILLDDEWGSFLHKEKFLVGLSIDGPREFHDRYRVDKGQKPTFDRVYAGLQTLKRHEVEFNTLTVLQNHNADHPLEIYEFLREEGSGFMQFIPIVERAADEPEDDGLELVDPTFEGKALVTRWSVGASQYGRFLCRIFDEWVRRDVGRVFIQMYDTALGAWMGQDPSLCIFARTCGKALIIEHNGDLYSCDHFVYPDYRLGNVHDMAIRDMVDSPLQQKFGNDKEDTLPQYCVECDYRFACNGGCPKQRFTRTPQGESGLNYLCKGYKMFFSHADPYMRFMANEVGQGRPAANVMEWARQMDAQKEAARKRVDPGRNDPCPCGSGQKYKRCCGKAA
ncbi:MAG: anaerobic sulfatase-maturation protein [Candidatus Latescibacterota bacterium]|jgi:uncharacterized protein